MVRPETAAFEVDVAPAIVAAAAEPIVKPMVKPLPAFNDVVLLAKPAEILRCALARDEMDTEWLPATAPVAVVTSMAAVLELLTLLALKLLASFKAVNASFMDLSMKLTAA